MTQTTIKQAVLNHQLKEGIVYYEKYKRSQVGFKYLLVVGLVLITGFNFTAVLLIGVILMLVGAWLRSKKEEEVNKK